MKTKEALGCIGTAVVLLFSSAWIPLIGPFISLLSPLPFVYYAAKRGLMEGIKVVGATILVAGLVSGAAGFPQIVILCVEFGVLGLILSEVFRRRMTFGYAVFITTTLMLLAGALILAGLGIAKGTSPPALIIQYFQNNLKETLQVYGNLGEFQGEDPRIQEYVKVMTGILARTYPALVIIGTGFVVWLNIVLCRPMFHHARLEYPDFGRADYWRTPDTMVWGVILAGFSLFLPLGGIRFIATNTLIVLLAIYVFHGLAIVLFFFNKYRVPLWLRVGGYILILFQQVVLVGLALAGLFDQWIDFRKIHHKKAN
ncbi:MAG: YybS family protein [Deltaproteobacteria bacterium]|nr:YybS family protein [Deltaproteobacteria bacterium]MBW2128626.1 YybS family protein [Deltaproteobacteria bacterium]MBW2305061.1 YybS family protein [Deltaproteobacteria bacterium]